MKPAVIAIEIKLLHIQITRRLTATLNFLGLTKINHKMSPTLSLWSKENFLHPAFNPDQLTSKLVPYSFPASSSKIIVASLTGDATYRMSLESTA